MNQGPVFKYLDIVINKLNNNVFYIMDYNKQSDMYYYDGLDGNSYMRPSKEVHNQFEKIGETTFDVLKKLNPNLKEKESKCPMNDNINQIKVEAIGYLCNAYYKSKIDIDKPVDLIDVFNDICYMNNEKEIKDTVAKFVIDNKK